MDVQSAYLNATLDYEIYVELPEGFKSKNKNYVSKLKKILIQVKTERPNLELNIPYLFNYTKFYPVTCWPLHVHSKCPRSNIYHFIVGWWYINSFKNWGTPFAN